MNAHQVPVHPKRLSVPANGAGPDFDLGPAWRRFCQSTTFASMLTGGFFVLVLLTLARSFRLPNSYSKAHWLHNYKHGFLPRGLIGELLYPVLQNKAPREVDGIITFFSWGVLAVFVLSMVAGVWLVLKNQRVLWRRALSASMFGVFATSPFFVQTGHLTGYFDHIVQLAGIVAVALVCHRRFLWAGLCCAFAILTHEMFVLTVMPAVFFAALVFLQGQAFDKKLKGLAGLLSIPVLVSLFILAKGSGSSDLGAMTQDITRYGVVDFPSMTTIHASQGFRSIFEDMVPTTMERLARPESIRAVLPGLLLLLVGGLVMPFGGRAIGLRVVFVLTSLTPLLMILTVWDGDTGRMTVKTLYCAFCGILALGYWASLQGRAEPELSRGRLGGVAAFALAGLALSIYQTKLRLWLMDREVDGEALMSLREAKTVEGYRCEQLLFPNSNFEQGSQKNWSSSGLAFRHQPVDRLPEQWERRPRHEGQHWVGTYDQRSQLGRPITQGDQPRGTMSSNAFVITKPYMNFLVGGGEDLGRLYVALMVNGKEVYRVTGRETLAMREVIWDLRPYYGQSAYIHIVDNSEQGWGHVMADGFCYRRASQELPKRLERQAAEQRERQNGMLRKGDNSTFPG